MDRTSRAVSAAMAVAHELGIPAETPRVLHDVFSVVVHLAPAPVVARVPTLSVPGSAAVRVRQQRELDVVTWLRSRVPVVRPYHKAPIEHDGLSMTLWDFVELAEPTGDGVGLVRELHAALRDYPGELAFMSGLGMIEPCLRILENDPSLIAADDLARARRAWSELAPLVESREAFAAAFPNVRVQPIHGDAPAYNLLHTTSGPRYADFEDVTIGPREWDLALFPTESYGEHLDEDVMRVMNRLGLLRAVCCHALVPQLPSLAAGIAPAVELWRKTEL